MRLFNTIVGHFPEAEFIFHYTRKILIKSRKFYHLHAVPWQNHILSPVIDGHTVTLLTSLELETMIKTNKSPCTTHTHRFTAINEVRERLRVGNPLVSLLLAGSSSQCSNSLCHFGVCLCYALLCALWVVATSSLCPCDYLHYEWFMTESHRKVNDYRICIIKIT